MTHPERYPTLEAFLAGPRSMVHAIAPETAIYGNGGTRRDAALQGVSMHDYAVWSQPRMFGCYTRFFELGVRHLIAPILRPDNFSEVGVFRQRIFDWIRWGLTGPEALATYAREQWQVRLVIVGDSCPELADVAVAVADATKQHTGPFLWLTVTPTLDDYWAWVAQAYRQGAQTQAEVVRQLCGADIPPATMLVGFGKPIVSVDVLPPVLCGTVQSYWTQRPGYTLTERTLREIFYDYAYLRRTWVADKTGRTDGIVEQRDRWESAGALGLGEQLGPYWIARSSTSPDS